MDEPQGKAKSIFLNAVELATAAECHAYLDAACGGDVALRREVEDLLRHFGQVGSFLDPEALDTTAPAEPQAPSEHVGTVIGPYKLLAQLGEGGFGVVFLAEQTQPIRRKVALKVLKPGMDTRKVIARFEAERHWP